MAGYQCLFDNLQNLMQSGMEDSCRILGDMFIYNCQFFDIPEFSVQKRNLLKMYADSLFCDRQYQRAMFYYQQAIETASVDHNSDIKWKLYQCNMELKKYQEAIETLTSIPAKFRNLQMTLSLAKLCHYFKKDSHSAMVYYRIVLTENPFVVEAALGLLSLGTTFSQLESILNQHPQSALLSFSWFSNWLKIQATISNHQYMDSVNEFEHLTSMGFKSSPEMKSQMGWCLSKLCKRNSAVEMFKLSRNQDPYILSHTDTYARLLPNKSSIPNSAQIADTALIASTNHVEPWVAKLWSVVRKSSWKDQSPDTPSVTVLINKILKISEPVKFINGETDFLFGSISSSRQSYEDAIVHYNRATKKDPTFFEAYESVLRCYMLMRNFKTAFSTMKIAVKHIKVPAQRLYLEAIVLANKNEYRARAKACLEAAIKHDPLMEKAVVSLCMIHRQEKNPSAAIEVLKKVFQVYESGNLHLEAGRCYAELRKLPEALEQYEITHKLDPDNREAILGMQEVEGMLQEGDYELEEDSVERSGNAAGAGPSYDEEEENKMESEEVLVLGSRETLEGVREFGDVPPLVPGDFNEEF